MKDVMIIGGGVAGLSAAIYTAYGNLSTLLFDTGKSQITKVSNLYNYPGIAEVSGPTLLETMRNQALNFQTDIVDAAVTKVSKEGDRFIVNTADETYSAKYVIIATNTNTSVFEGLGIEIETNERVPSGKINSVSGAGFDGTTSIENLYIAGLLTGISSQSVIAAGQGAQVGIDIVSKETGKSYIWHDK